MAEPFPPLILWPKLPNKITLSGYGFLTFLYNTNNDTSTTTFQVIIGIILPDKLLFFNGVLVMSLVKAVVQGYL